MLNMAGTLQLPVVSDNPRVVIDTSPPFGSVKEAVTRFGGRGSWVPVHTNRLDGVSLFNYHILLGLTG